MENDMVGLEIRGAPPMRSVTFPGSGSTTPGPDSAGANNIMYRVVLPLCGFLLLAAVITIFCCYKYIMAWRRREQKQATDLAMVRVEKPVVQKPLVQIKKNNIRPAIDNIKKDNIRPVIDNIKKDNIRPAMNDIKKDNIRPAMNNIKKEMTIIEQLKAAKKVEEKIMKITPKIEEEKIMKKPSKTDQENITRPSRLKRFHKWIQKRTQKKNTCCSCRSMD